MRYGVRLRAWQSAKAGLCTSLTYACDMFGGARRFRAVLPAQLGTGGALALDRAALAFVPCGALAGARFGEKFADQRWLQLGG
jgi:hypothetical protein